MCAQYFIATLSKTHYWRVMLLAMGIPPCSVARRDGEGG